MEGAPQSECVLLPEQEEGEDTDFQPTSSPARVQAQGPWGPERTRRELQVSVVGNCPAVGHRPDRC